MKSGRIVLRLVTWLAAMAILGFVFASPSFATSMTLTGVGDGATLGNVYVDPYSATVGASTTPVPVICDDWSNNSYVGESWTATAINAVTVSNTSLGTPMFGNNQSLYNEAAYLASLLMANPTNLNNQVEDSFAIWALTYPYNSPQDATSPLTYLEEYGTSSQYQATLVLICEAQGGYCAANNQMYTGEANFNAAGWEILTPVPGTSNPKADGTPQEFLTYVPEPSTWLMLVLGLGGLFLLKRRQRNSNSAPVLAA